MRALCFVIMIVFVDQTCCYVFYCLVYYIALQIYQLHAIYLYGSSYVFSPVKELYPVLIHKYIG